MKDYAVYSYNLKTLLTNIQEDILGLAISKQSNLYTTDRIGMFLHNENSYFHISFELYHPLGHTDLNNLSKEISMIIHSLADKIEDKFGDDHFVMKRNKLHRCGTGSYRWIVKMHLNQPQLCVWIFW